CCPPNSACTTSGCLTCPQGTTACRDHCCPQGQHCVDGRCLCDDGRPPCAIPGAVARCCPPTQRCTPNGCVDCPTGTTVCGVYCCPPDSTCDGSRCRCPDGRPACPMSDGTVR